MKPGIKVQLSLMMFLEFFMSAEGQTILAEKLQIARRYLVARQLRASNCDWSGFYIGGHVGYGEADFSGRAIGEDAQGVVLFDESVAFAESRIRKLSAEIPAPLHTVTCTPPN